MPTHAYIAFEGPIASGKTTHATLLAKQLGSALLLEDFPGNEFLADFYGDKERWGLDRGDAIATPLTESVQIGVYRAIHFDLGGTGTHSQDLFEFTLSRQKLFSGQSGGLRAIAQGDREFNFFHSHDIDPFEMKDASEPFGWGVELQSCSNCHESAGIHSFLSCSRERFGPTDVPPPKLIDSSPSRESAAQIRWIEKHHSFAFAEAAASRTR